MSGLVRTTPDRHQLWILHTQIGTRLDVPGYCREPVYGDVEEGREDGGTVEEGEREEVEEEEG